MRRSCDVVLVALAREVALKLPSSSFLREDVLWFQVEFFLLGGLVLIAFRLLVALSASGELSVNFSLDGCFEIDQLLEVVIIGGVSNQVIGQLFAVFVFLKTKKQSVPLCCILLSQLFIGQGPLEVTLKIIVILSVKRQLQKLPPEEATLAIVFLKKVSEQFDVMDDIEVVVLFLLLLVLDSLEAELDCLFVVAAFLLKGLLEDIKWAFFGRSFGLGLCLGLWRRSCDFFECFFELLKISQCSLVGGRLLNQDACAEGLNNFLRLAGFGHDCLFDCRNDFFGWFFDLKMRDGRLTNELCDNLFHIFIFSLLTKLIQNTFCIINLSFCLCHDKTHMAFDCIDLPVLLVAVYAQTMQTSFDEDVGVAELAVFDEQHKRQFARNACQLLQQLQFDQFSGELRLLNILLQSKALQVRLFAHFLCIDRRVNVVLLIFSDDYGGSDLRVVQLFEFLAGKKIDHH